MAKTKHFCSFTFPNKFVMRASSEQYTAAAMVNLRHMMGAGMMMLTTAQNIHIHSFGRRNELHVRLNTLTEIKVDLPNKVCVCVRVWLQGHGQGVFSMPLYATKPLSLTLT